MADSRVFSGAAEETAMAYVQSLLRTGVASAHALHLNDQLISCVARRQGQSARRSTARVTSRHEGVSCRTHRC